MGSKSVRVALFVIKPEQTAGGAMIRLIHSLVLACAIAVTAATAIARSRHYGAPPSATYFGNPNYDPNAGFYNPVYDPDAVSVGGTYAGSGAAITSASAPSPCANGASRWEPAASLVAGRIRP
jgi:hypothetical protein